MLPGTDVFGRPMQVNFLSRSVISGFTSAVAVVFIVAQVLYSLGFTSQWPLRSAVVQLRQDRCAC